MKLFRVGALSAVLALLLGSAPSALQAQSLPSATAEQVIGQPDFDENVQGTEPGKSTSPAGLGVHTESGALFVVDPVRGLLRWDDAAGRANGAAEDAVFGRMCAGFAAAADCFLLPTALTVDDAGGVWVLDVLFRRMLYFADAVTAAGGGPAIRVLETTTFTATGSLNYHTPFIQNDRLYALTPNELHSWSYATLPANGTAPITSTWNMTLTATAAAGDPTTGGGAAAPAPAPVGDVTPAAPPPLPATLPNTAGETADFPPALGALLCALLLMTAVLTSRRG